MYHQGIDRDAALAQIRQARPSIGPNEGFMKQLDIYYAAKFKVSPKDKHIRAFYLERSVQEVLSAYTDRVVFHQTLQYSPLYHRR